MPAVWLRRILHPGKAESRKMTAMFEVIMRKCMDDNDCSIRLDYNFGLLGPAVSTIPTCTDLLLMYFVTLLEYLVWLDVFQQMCHC